MVVTLIILNEVRLSPRGIFHLIFLMIEFGRIIAATIILFNHDMLGNLERRLAAVRLIVRRNRRNQRCLRNFHVLRWNICSTCHALRSYIRLQIDGSKRLASLRTMACRLLDQRLVNTVLFKDTSTPIAIAHVQVVSGECVIDLYICLVLWTIYFLLFTLHGKQRAFRRYWVVRFLVEPLIIIMLSLVLLIFARVLHL